MNKFSKVEIIVMVISFIICLSMIIIAQRHVSIVNLGWELLGLAGLLTLLFYYNRKFK